jgi:hypothetical protein
MSDFIVMVTIVNISITILCIHETTKTTTIGQDAVENMTVRDRIKVGGNLLANRATATVIANFVVAKAAA